MELILSLAYVRDVEEWAVDVTREISKNGKVSLDSDMEDLVDLTEGKGFCARRQERQEIKKMQDLIENKDDILVIPDNGEIKTLDKSRH